MLPLSLRLAGLPGLTAFRGPALGIRPGTSRCRPSPACSSGSLERRPCGQEREKPGRRRGVVAMQTPFKTAVEGYLRSKTLSCGTRNEYASTLRKWEQWGRGAPIEELRRKDVREFL